MKNPLIFYRVARKMYLARIPFFPQMLTLFVRLVYGCYLPHTAVIGKGCVFGYGGLSIVIGGGCIIEDGVELGAGVLIGGNARVEGMPRIGKGSYIGAGAKVLGPISVGENCVIAANTVVLKSVPDSSVVAGSPARIVKSNIDINQFLFHRSK